MPDERDGRGLQPRRGLPGVWDGIVGPGAGPAENLGTVGCGILGAVLAPRLARGGGARRGARLVVRLLALDLWGGAWCNNTPAAARWYGRPGQGPRHLLAFATRHLHPSPWRGWTAEGGSAGGGQGRTTVTCCSGPRW